MSATPSCPDLPDRCVLQHAVFAALGDVRFRLSPSDGVPMMAVQLGDREAQLPIEALRREYDIGKDSADGRMLELIGSALEFVPCLQLGDRFPAEIRTGEASWTPTARHQRLAAIRLRLDLCAWMQPAGRWAGAGRSPDALLHLADDPALAAETETLAHHAAGRLAMRDGGDLLRLLKELGHELAFIEALRERLLDRVTALCAEVDGLAGSHRHPAASSDTLAQVGRLLSIGAKQIGGRFEDLAGHTEPIDALLRDAANQRGFIRSNRDWLYRAQRAWDPILDRWAQEGGGDVTALLTATYQFLAPRFMPTTAWQRPGSNRQRGPAAARMAW